MIAGYFLCHINLQGGLQVMMSLAGLLEVEKIRSAYAIGLRIHSTQTDD